MAEEPAVLAAKRNIERVLNDFVCNRAESKVNVFLDDFGHLQAVVASHAFETIPPRERQIRVRDFLREHAMPEDLAHLYGVFVKSHKECDEDLLANGGTKTLKIGLRDKKNANG